MVAMTDPYVAEDLAAAPSRDIDRLRKAEQELAKRDAALRAAEDQREAARAAILEAGMAGRDDSKHAEAFANAEAAVSTNRQLRDLRAEVVDSIRQELVLSVRGKRAAEVAARLRSIQDQYDEQCQLLEAVAGILDRLGTLREQERTQAAEMAAARREGASDALHGFTLGTGRRYRSIPDVRVGFYVVTENGARQDVESPGHLSDHLRRHEGA